MSTFTEAAAALRQASVGIETAHKTAVAEATRQLTDLVLVGQGRAGAASGRLRGVGQRGAQIGVVGTVANGEGLVRATGPAHLLDHPTAAHLIAPKRAAALRTPEGPRRSVQHPGTHGKLYFEEAVAQFEPRVADIFATTVDAAIEAL